MRLPRFYVWPHGADDWTTPCLRALLQERPGKVRLKWIRARHSQLDSEPTWADGRGNEVVDTGAKAGLDKQPTACGTGPLRGQWQAPNAIMQS
jgi:hypothetical protein